MEKCIKDLDVELDQIGVTTLKLKSHPSEKVIDINITVVGRTSSIVVWDTLLLSSHHAYQTSKAKILLDWMPMNSSLIWSALVIGCKPYDWCRFHGLNLLVKRTKWVFWTRSWCLMEKSDSFIMIWREYEYQCSKHEHELLLLTIQHILDKDQYLLDGIDACKLMHKIQIHACIV